MKQVIRRILREEFRNLSSVIEELLQPTVDRYGDYVCEVQVFQDVMNPKKYSLRVFFVGGPDSKVWPTTQSVQSSREKVMKEMWETIYKFTGLSVELDSSTVTECKDSITNKQEQNEGEITERCWKGYTQKGMKTMFGKRYPNCVKVKKKRVNEASLGDHLKKLLNFKGDEKREFQKIVDIITKITKKEYPVEGMVGVAVTNVDKKIWGQNFNNPKSVGLRWDFAITIRPLFTQYNPNNSDEYGEKVLKFQDEFINNAYGMGFNISSPIGHEKVKDYRINFNWDKPINVKQVEL